MKKLLCCILMLSAISIYAQQQWRGMWVDAWNKGMYNKEQIKEMIRITEEYGFNAIAVQVRCRGDALYFPKYPNIEPRRANLASDFDPLQEIIMQAHAKGIEVHAWATTFLVAGKAPSSLEHVYHKHNDYLTQDSDGNQKIGEGYYLDPGHPGALEWNRKVVLDIVENYDVDGYHFDYIRYPQQNAGFNPVAVARFNKEYGKKGKPASNDKDFSEWRRDQITNWLRQMYVEISAIKPSLKITAATFASRHDAYSNRFQDWAQWMKEGILDANFPMNYARTNDIFKPRTDDILKHSYQRHVYMGVGSYLLPVDRSIEQLVYAQNKGANGLILFSYAYNIKSGKSEDGYKKIHQKVFSEIAEVPNMPWKNTVGHIKGQAIGKNTWVSLSPLQIRAKTDNEGRFSFSNILPGEYEIKCEDKSEVLEVKVIAGKVTECGTLLIK